MGSHRILADTKDHCSFLLKLGISVRKSAGLLGTARCIILGIKIKDHLFPKII